MEGVSDIVIFLGRFHPLVVHLPIGFLILALSFEFLLRLRRFQNLETGIRLIWLLCAVVASVAVVLGYLLSLGGGYDEQTLALHQWSGISLVVMSAGCYLLRKEGLFSRSYVKHVFLVLLFLISATLILTGHLGSLTHGSEYLVEYAPKPIQRLVGIESTSVMVRPKLNSLDSADIFKDGITPIMSSRCVSCHNSSKRKGELNLTSFVEMMKGGENGVIIKAGSLATSEIYRRVTLPYDHKEFMPSEGKRPLTEEQVAIIEWWIEKDAPENASITSLNPDKGMIALFEKYFGLGEDNEYEINVLPADTAVLNALTRNGFIVRRLAAASNLLEVKFSGTLSDTTKIERLIAIKDHISWLQLSNTEISDDQLQIVGQFSNLRKLNLSRNAISDKGVNHLKGLSNLRYLNVYGTNVTDSILGSVITMPKLEELYLWQTNVSSEYVEMLKQRTPGIKIIYNEQ